MSTDTIKRLKLSNYISGIHISTAFLGLDKHRQYETMVFGKSGQIAYQMPSATEDEARRNHEETVNDIQRLNEKYQIKYLI